MLQHTIRIVLPIYCPISPGGLKVSPFFPRIFVLKPDLLEIQILLEVTPKCGIESGQ
jgi:hypothetical protein